LLRLVALTPEILFPAQKMITGTTDKISPSVEIDILSFTDKLTDIIIIVTPKVGYSAFAFF
jgi:hypothetical protein